MDGERISRPTVHGRTKDSEFEIACRLETQLLSVNEGLRIQRLSCLTSEAGDWVGDELIAIQLTEKKFDAHRAEPSQNAGKLEWRHPVETEHVDGLNIVAEHHRAAIARAPLETLLAKRQFPVGKHQSNVRIEQRELLRRRLVGAGRENRILVYRLNNLTRRERQGRDARRSLRFATNIGEPASPGRSCRKAVYGAPTLPI